MPILFLFTWQFLLYWKYKGKGQGLSLFTAPLPPPIPCTTIITFWNTRSGCVTVCKCAKDLIINLLYNGSVSGMKSCIVSVITVVEVYYNVKLMWCLSGLCHGKKCQVACKKSKGSDQIAHLCSLIRVFTVPFSDSLEMDTVQTLIDQTIAALAEIDFRQLFLWHNSYWKCAFI